MADSKFGVFCNQWLLHNNCSRGNTCIFAHARMRDVTLFSTPTEEEEFVRGAFEPSRGRKGRPNRRNNARSRADKAQNSNSTYHLLGNTNGYRKSDRNASSSSSGINMPSTSSHNSASSYSAGSMDALHASGSGTGSKKKTKKLGFIPHTVTSGALEQTESKNKAESSRNQINLKCGNINVDDWVKAPEFIPKNMAILNTTTNFANLNLDEDKSKKKLCPYAERDGICKYPIGECTYLHGNKCDFCGRGALHPYNEEQCRQHTQECIKQHERDMELSFAIARSKEKVCGVCFEVIMQKSAVEQRFGILPNCNHCFCLTCIRKWRQAKQFENKIIRACPECRVTSDFVCPSTYWVDTKEEKEKVIENYKQVLSKKDCKYFKKGNGSCPFGNKCFYLHALADGTKVDVGPPPSHRNNDVTQEIDIIQRLLMLGYLRDSLTETLDFEDILNIVDLEMLSDTDDSELFSECDEYCGAEFW